MELTLEINCCGIRCIRYFHIDYIAPRYPPKVCITIGYYWVLGITVVPREIKDNGYVKCWGVNKVHYGL